MYEHYIDGKVEEFHGEQIEQLDIDRRIARIMNFIHREIEKAHYDTEYKLMRKLELCLKENLEDGRG